MILTQRRIEALADAIEARISTWPHMCRQDVWAAIDALCDEGDQVADAMLDRPRVAEHRMWDALRRRGAIGSAL